MNVRLFKRRQHRWRKTVEQYHCPTCRQMAGQPCTMAYPVPPSYRDFHLTRADMARRATREGPA